MKSEATRGKPRGNLLRRSSLGYAGRVCAELRRSHNDKPAVANPGSAEGFAEARAMAGRLAILTRHSSFGATAVHPCGKPQGTAYSAGAKLLAAKAGLAKASKIPCFSKFAGLVLAIVFMPVIEIFGESDSSSINILPNPGFEADQDKNNIPDGWKFEQLQGKGIIGLDNTIKHNGNYSVKISGGPNDRTAVAYHITNAVAVKPGETYKFSVWYKTSGVKRDQHQQSMGARFGPVVRFTFTDEQQHTYGAPYLYEKYAQGLSGTNDWMELTKKFVVPISLPCKITKCHIILSLWHSEGTIWFDDVRLEKTGTESSYQNQPSTSYPKDILLKPVKPEYESLKNKPAFLQIWPWSTKDPVGNPSVEIITARDKWIPELKKYGIGAIQVMPMEHNDVGTGLVSDEELKKAVSDYQKNGFPVILYSSLMHVGHDLSWHQVAKEHPDWIVRDQFGNPEMYYADDWHLCYNTTAFDYCLDYTIKMVEKLNPDGVMLDNQYRWWDACYCDACQGKFKNHLLAKFKNKERDFRTWFGISVKEFKSLKISDDMDSRLYREWVEYNNFYSCAEAIVKTRKALRKIKPDIMVFANIGPIFVRPNLINLADYQDFMAFESSRASSKIMAEKLLCAQALALGKPVYDYEYTWDPSDWKKLLPPGKLKLLIATTISYNCVPYIVPYGFDRLENPRGINKDSLKAMSDYLIFLKNNKELFLNSGMYTDSAVFIPNESYCEGVLLPLIDSQLPFEVIRELNTNTLKKYKILFLIDSRCISDEQIVEIEKYVKSGGVLVFTGETGNYTETGEERPKPGLITAFDLISEKEKISQYGKGTVIYAPGTNCLASAIQNAVAGSLVIVNEPSRNLAAIPYYHADDRSAINGIYIHCLNHNPDSLIKGTKIKVILPEGFKITKAEYLSPDSKEALSIKYDIIEEGNIRTASFSIPDINIYGVLKIE